MICNSYELIENEKDYFVVVFKYDSDLKDQIYRLLLDFISECPHTKNIHILISSFRTEKMISHKFHWSEFRSSLCLFFAREVGSFLKDYPTCVMIGSIEKVDGIHSFSSE
jgi:hypothetical protein